MPDELLLEHLPSRAMQDVPNLARQAWPSLRAQPSSPSLAKPQSSRPGGQLNSHLVKMSQKHGSLIAAW